MSSVTPAAALEPIPRDPGWPIVGNLFQITPGEVGQHLLARSRHHDGIFELDFAGRRVPFVSSVALAAEVCDPARFRKIIGPPLSYLRDMAGDGLFTAHSDEPNWGCAHRILMPAFSQRAMKGYFDVMLRVANRLVDKWDHKGPDADIAVADDMTRLTLDTIALSGFGYDFESFASEQLDPFIVAMVGALEEAMRKLTRLPIQDRFMGRAHRKFADDVTYMRNLVDDVIRQRRAAPRPGMDLLNLMLEARDPETDRQLDDANIRNQVITFLIAGHETTSGLLTFTLYELLRNPGVLAQAYAEVDAVLPGDAPPVYADLARLPVLDRVLKETLRLWPTAPAFAVAPFEDVVIGGRYRLRQNRRISVVLTALHRDPKVWEHPERFDIDRFLPENEARLPTHAYMPFGHGERACIGRQFALTEAKLALALMLRNFAFHDTYDYQFRLKETLTIKPDNFVLRARRRRPHERIAAQAVVETATDTAQAEVRGNGQAMTVLCASSLGTARELAEQIHGGAVAAGFDATLADLDDVVDALPTTGLLVVVAATYNGRAPDSGRRFEAMLDAGGADGYRAEGLRLALLGCGNSQWATYQAFPRRVFDFFTGAGAVPLLARGEADGNADFDQAAERWLAQLWQAVQADGASAGGIGVDVQLRSVDAMRADTLPAGTQSFTVLANTELVGDPTGLWDFAIEAPRTSTREIRLQLPPGTTYQTGDHVAVWPQNDAAQVLALCERLDLDPEGMVTLSAPHGAGRGLPIGEALPLRQLLTHFVELQDVVSRQTLRALAQTTACPHTRQSLEQLAADDAGADADTGYAAQVAARRLNVLDVLVRFPAITLTLQQLLACTVPMRPRFYSIASSPLVSPDVATLLVGTVWAPALSGRGQFRGVASTWLQALAPGARVSASIRTPNPPFAPPADPAVPMLLIGPGTGIAPFRGFLEERAAQLAAGGSVTPVQLYFGCRHPQHDWLFYDEIARWADTGVAEVHTAYSVLPGAARYVQDLLWQRRAQVWERLQAGAMVYVCGDGRRMAPAVRQVLIDIGAEQGGMTPEAASDWFAGLVAQGRYRQDVFN
ncbi:MAG: cytochrome P450 [Cupriavidus sp.]|nr:cytochrome P450 [Cupriavidus sp.]